MSWLHIGEEEFRAGFGRRPFLVRHRIADEELFSLERLAQLARELPPSSIEHNLGALPVSIEPAKVPRNGLSPEETIRRIEQCGSWLVLKNVEQSPAYRALLDCCLAQVHGLSAQLTRGMSEKEGFIFVSSSGSVTPYHMDPEENFLLQIRGRKTMHVFEPGDRSVLSQAQIERFMSGAHRNLKFCDEYHAKSRTFELTPGTGVHVPQCAPHWVKNGPEVSISFSITFQTRESRRRRQVHRMNARLRRFGLRPAAVGESPLRDGMKELLYRVLAKLESRARG
jgi:hypothetical protein